MEKLTYRQVVEDTYKYYTEDPSRRAISGTGCAYYDPETENCCAVGRYISNPEDFTNEEIGGEDDAIGLFERYNFEDIMNPEVLHLDNFEFWKKLQDLHDFSSFWKNRAITQKGIDYYEGLLEDADKLDGQE